MCLLYLLDRLYKFRLHAALIFGSRTFHPIEAATFICDVVANTFMFRQPLDKSIQDCLQGRAYMGAHASVNFFSKGRGFSFHWAPFMSRPFGIRIPNTCPCGTMLKPTLITNIQAKRRQNNGTVPSVSFKCRACKRISEYKPDGATKEMDMKNQPWVVRDL
jgi:hypothetical protein